jgi:Glycosyl transferase family 11
MIIVTIKGGLGNQLFQYACGRALALRNKDILKLDISGYSQKNSDTLRSYSLWKFHIIESIATQTEISSFKDPHNLFSKFYRKIKTKLGFANIEFIPRTLTLKGNVYLNGYWQTEKYFADCAETIRREFTLKDPLGPAAQRFADMIDAAGTAADAIEPATISLHVRRGDVARDAWKNPYYGITTPEYYARALERAREEISRRNGSGAAPIRVFVFSDDIEWTRRNIAIPFPTTYIEGPGIADYEELMLMSRCRHHIIANSSFSWWGAWLDPRPDTIVIAPKEWIRKRKRQHKDICPDSWLRV